MSSEISEAERTGELIVAIEAGVATLTLNRPRQRNALSNDLLAGLAEALGRCDRDRQVRCIMIAGSEKVFASGADLHSLSELEVEELYLGPRFEAWAAIRRVRTPTLAAVAGFCLGGGCELAIGCDIVIAAEGATFGFPETALGLIPAAGGTQRLPRAIGRAKAMDLILSGRRLDAAEAERTGLVSRVVPAAELLEAASTIAAEVSARGPYAQILAKEAIDSAHEVELGAGMDLERRAFSLAFASPQAKEGIAAFLEKRKPRWQTPAD